MTKNVADVVDALEQAKQSAWVIAGSAALLALALRDALRAAKGARAHLARLEAAAVACAACQPTGAER